MRFLLDQDVWEITAKFLESRGHEVRRSIAAGLSRASDEDVLEAAHRDDCVLVTRDKGFGQLVFAGRRATAGVILLRVEPATVAQVHEDLEALLHAQGKAALRGAFAVVEPGKRRVRRL